MMEAIAAIGSIAKARPDAVTAEPVSVPLSRPTEAEAASFAHAVGGMPTLDTIPAPPVGGDSLSARLAAQTDRLSAHLQALGPQSVAPEGAAVPAAGGHPLADARVQMGDAVAQIERAYMFATETTMASRGSTETTKIFNTLLKGQ